MSEMLQSEDVKLYEYNQYKPELEDEFIRHHQALGAHWGIYNGPPYPLSRMLSTGKRLKPAAKGVSSDGDGRESRRVTRKKRKSLAKARKTRAKNIKMRTLEKQTKETIIKNKDIKSMLSNVDKFTNKEINDMLDRLNVEQRLREAVSKQENAKKSWGKKVRDNIGTAVKEEVPKTLGEMTRTATNKGIKLASNRVLKELVGPESVNRYNDKWQDIIDQLIPDPTQKKKENKK